MRKFPFVLPLLVAFACAVLLGASPPPAPAVIYVPRAVFCYPQPHGPVTASPLCPVLPGNIGPDPALDIKIAYNGIVDAKPTSAQNDVQTPFDNLSWQTFVALNWTKGKEARPAKDGLNGDGARVWEGWPRVSQVFGNSRVQANCQVPAGYTLFSIASNGDGTPATRNEEYIQAATGDPAIDVSGNWTLYERRVNGIEIAYLKAPGGNKNWDLTTLGGQNGFAQNNTAVNFPAVGDNGQPNGAMEIKAAWRILDPAKHAANVKRFYVVRAVVAVAPDLVFNGAKPRAPICAKADLGLVAMHIIQKNPVTKNDLKPQWFWTTFEHVDNAPLAQAACDPTSPASCTTLGQLACPAQQLMGAPDYSYFNAKYPAVPTNQPPQLLLGGKAFLWNPVEPYAFSYLTKTKDGARIGTQISRCWRIYALTQALNVQWRAELHKIGSVFENYMLVGTQWGASTTATPNPKIPTGGVPNFLSNSVVETYLQTLADPKNPFGNGSCISCHNSATLIVNNKTPANLSFLPDLVNLLQVRKPPMPPKP